VIIRALAYALLLGVLGLIGFLVPSVVIASDDPPSTTTSTSSTTAAVVTVTVEGRYQGRKASWWGHRAQRARKQLRRQQHTLAKVRASLRATVPLAPTRVLAAHGRPSASGLERAFLCIHRFEGSWPDPSAPYWGGLQMDESFMRHHGLPFYKAFGTADHWTPAMQLAVAELAYLSGRGFYPWPNTARYCGLL
jgi:hypothetical protein